MLRPPSSDPLVQLRVRPSVLRISDRVLLPSPVASLHRRIVNLQLPLPRRHLVRVLLQVIRLLVEIVLLCRTPILVRLLVTIV